MSITSVPTFDLEKTLARDGYEIIIGFDEVGRGALAGPVMVGAAAFLAPQLSHAQNTMPQYLADSKMLTEHRREMLFEPLQQWADAYAIGAATNKEIDEWGIAHALGIAALRALDSVERTLFTTSIATDTHIPRVGAILDGPNDYITKALGTFEAPEIPVPAHVITQVKGDQHCGSVACAAVLAKVTRDRLMIGLAQNSDYTAYGWERNKGYGSKAHRAAIAEHGPSDLHRISWHLV